MKKENDKNERRSFLRNSVLAAFSVGVSPLLSKSNIAAGSENLGDCNETTLDLYGQGPFYTPNAPVIESNQLANEAEPGTRLLLSGIARTLDCTQVIPNMLIEIWHANDAGAYDNTGFNLRGQTYSNAQGYYQFETILPGKYLNGASYRPRHIHFKLTPPGFPARVTQLYFEGDTDIPGDAAASVAAGTYDATERIISLALNKDGKYEGTWDIFINAGLVGIVPDLHLLHGMIYSASPNPFTNRVEFHYGVFNTSRVALHVFDIRGTLVSTLDEVTVTPEKYHSIWIPPEELPAGVYIAVLKINDLQVHYTKLVKQ